MFGSVQLRLNSLSSCLVTKLGVMFLSSVYFSC